MLVVHGASSAVGPLQKPSFSVGLGLCMHGKQAQSAAEHALVLGKEDFPTSACERSEYFHARPRR